MNTHTVHSPHIPLHRTSHLHTCQSLSFLSTSVFLFLFYMNKRGNAGVRGSFTPSAFTLKREIAVSLTLLWCSRGRWPLYPPGMRAVLPGDNIDTRMARALQWRQWLNQAQINVLVLCSRSEKHKQDKKNEWTASVMAYRSRVEVFFLFSFLLWIYNL